MFVIKMTNGSAVLGIVITFALSVVLLNTLMIHCIENGWAIERISKVVRVFPNICINIAINNLALQANISCPSNKFYCIVLSGLSAQTVT